MFEHLKNKKILITGSSGFVGTNLINELRKENIKFKSLTSKHDLRLEKNVKKIFNDYNPDVVFHLAAKVGGILANIKYKKNFYLDNSLINLNILNYCEKYNVKKIFAMGTGCAYPKKLEKKILKEKNFLDGSPEITNDAYAYAKRNMLIHLRYLYEEKKIPYVYCIPANIYGEFDNFHPTNSHVVPALIRKFYEGVKYKKKKIEIWGSGKAKRDFLYIKHLINAMHIIDKSKFVGAINVAQNNIITIKQIAHYLKKISNFNNILEFNKFMPEGQKIRIFDTTKIKKLNWEDKPEFYSNLSKTYNWYSKNYK